MPVRMSALLPMYCPDVACCRTFNEPFVSDTIQCAHVHSFADACAESFRVTDEYKEVIHSLSFRQIPLTTSVIAFQPISFSCQHSLMPRNFIIFSCRI